jgi:AraC-like DNA-binding protein
MSNASQSSLIPFYYISSFRKSVAAGRICPFHCHNEVEVVYHPTGEGYTKTRNGVMNYFKAGDIVVYQPGVFHSQHMTTSGEDYCLIARIADNKMLFGDQVSVLNKTSNPYIIQEIYSLTNIPTKYGYEQVLNLRVSALMMAMVTEWNHNELKENISSGERYASEARYLCENILQFRTVAEIAAKINISPEYLRHIFYNRFGHSLKSCIDSLRIKRAEELLMHSTLPQKVIANQSGFSSESYFCTAFKKAKNITPGEFKRNFLLTA